MQVVFPDILKKNKNEWSFSEEEPWKPIAKENASDEVKKAVSDFIADMNGEIDLEPKVVAKSFLDVLYGVHEEFDEDAAIDSVVSTWTDTDGIYAEVEKGNPYHDPSNGRFTNGPASGNPMIRTGPPPKNTKIAYKVFVAKDGKLYPPMVANPDGQATPVGVWLNASEGVMATDKDGNPITNTLGRNKVKAGGKGTQGGSGTLAYRPGWHLGELPIAEQFYTKDKATGEKKQKKNFVWAECEIAADFDYQKEAMSYGYNKNGKFQHSLAGLPKIPTDGYYTYRTNPDPKTKPWYITGAMKVNRILTDAETNSILRANGIEPMKRMGGDLDLASLGFTETNFVGKSASNLVAKTFDEILKFNPYHDAKGRFSTADGAASFTYAPGKSKAHDMAIEREKKRAASEADREHREKFGQKIRDAALFADTNDPKVLVSIGKEVAKEIDSRFKKKKKMGEAEDDEPQTEDIYDVLRDVRDFGYPWDGDRLLCGCSGDISNARLKSIVEEATSRYPTEWFENTPGKASIMVNDSSGRAMYSRRAGVQVYAREDADLVSRLRLPSDKITNTGIANQISHELGHWFEDYNWSVGDAARSYLSKRTKNSETIELYPGEYSKPDKFADSYMGKVYSNGSTEITSVLVQKMGWVNPKQAITQDFFGASNKDVQSYNYALGLLAVGG